MRATLTRAGAPQRHEPCDHNARSGAVHEKRVGWNPAVFAPYCLSAQPRESTNKGVHQRYLMPLRDDHAAVVMFGFVKPPPVLFVMFLGPQGYLMPLRDDHAADVMFGFVKPPPEFLFFWILQDVSFR